MSNTYIVESMLRGEEPALEDLPLITQTFQVMSTEALINLSLEHELHPSVTEIIAQVTQANLQQLRADYNVENIVKRGLGKDS